MTKSPQHRPKTKASEEQAECNCTSIDAVSDRWQECQQSAGEEHDDARSQDQGANSGRVTDVPDRARKGFNKVLSALFACDAGASNAQQPKSIL
jgi:hypothetical protein